jgi:hypothetical protein
VARVSDTGATAMSGDPDYEGQDQPLLAFMEAPDDASYQDSYTWEFTRVPIVQIVSA